MIIDSLEDKIIQTQNPACVGLDTSPEYLPEQPKTNAADAVLSFNKCIVDNVCDLVPAVKVQIAYYEALGREGMQCFYDTCRYAKERGLFVIADCKRNDIGATAAQYAKTYFEGELGDYIDLLTVNGYLGSDGISPFVEMAKRKDKGIFVLVKTSNPSAGELQDLRLADGRTVYEAVADMVAAADDERGKYGFTRTGAVVGATHPREAEIVRGRLPHTFFLVPGYGAQGGNAAMLKSCFKEGGMGGIVNNSRGILCAYRKTDAHANEKNRVGLCARDAVLQMKEDLLSVLGNIHA